MPKKTCCNCIKSLTGLAHIVGCKVIALPPSNWPASAYMTNNPIPTDIANTIQEDNTSHFKSKEILGIPIKSLEKTTVKAIIPVDKVIKCFVTSIV